MHGERKQRAFKSLPACGLLRGCHDVLVLLELLLEPDIGKGAKSPLLHQSQSIAGRDEIFQQHEMPWLPVCQPVEPHQAAYYQCCAAERYL
jgi:hypothetical protein